MVLGRFAPKLGARRPVRGRIGWVPRVNPEYSLRLHRIVPAVAPRVAPEQAPTGEHQAPQYAVLPDRAQGIARAGGLILAASRKTWGDHPLVEDDWGADQHAGDAPCADGARAHYRLPCVEE